MHPLNQDDAVTLAGLHVHSVYGDYEPANPIVTQSNISNFVPAAFRYAPLNITIAIITNGVQRFNSQ